MKYAAVITGTVDGPTTLTQLKEEGYINWPSYLTLSSYEDGEMQMFKLVDYKPNEQSAT